MDENLTYQTSQAEQLELNKKKFVKKLKRRLIILGYTLIVYLAFALIIFSAFGYSEFVFGYLNIQLPPTVALIIRWRIHITAILSCIITTFLIYMFYIKKSSKRETSGKEELKKAESFNEESPPEKVRIEIEEKHAAEDIVPSPDVPSSPKKFFSLLGKKPESKKEEEIPSAPQEPKKKFFSFLEKKPAPEPKLEKTEVPEPELPPKIAKKPVFTFKQEEAPVSPSVKKVLELLEQAQNELARKKIEKARKAFHEAYHMYYYLPVDKQIDIVTRIHSVQEEIKKHKEMPKEEKKTFSTWALGMIGKRPAPKTPEEKVDYLIEESSKFVKNENLKEAKAFYKQAYSMYYTLPIDKQVSVLSKLKKIDDQIKELETAKEKHKMPQLAPIKEEFKPEPEKEAVKQKIPEPEWVKKQEEKVLPEKEKKPETKPEPKPEPAKEAVSRKIPEPDWDKKPAQETKPKSGLDRLKELEQEEQQLMAKLKLLPEEKKKTPEHKKKEQKPHKTEIDERLKKIKTKSVQNLLKEEDDIHSKLKRIK